LARDIHNVTDDVSLVMREVIDATENAMVLETALHLNKGAKSANAKDYIKTQVASKRQLNNKLQQVANKSQKIINNVIDNIGSYTGTDTKQLKKDTAMGMKMLVRSAKSLQNRTLKKVSRLERYKTSAEFIPNLDKSIISQTKTGIDKGLPVTYKNGRKVTYKAYMEMAVRTGIQQEIGNRQLEAGRNANIVFYVVNEFGDCADDHADYQGRMYYDEKYLLFPLTTDAKAMIRKHIQNNNLQSIQDVRDKPPYLTTRPNCRHKMKPVAIDRVLQESVENIKDDLGYKTKSYRPENYEATKTQRYNERNIRKYKQRNLTYMALYKDTNNKEYLLQAQKEKRQAMLWQKRQRQHMKANPDLFRDYERENPKVLLQDLGLKDKKIQSDPNKPPAPITNKPPQTPPVAMSEVVKEHLEIPEQKTDMFQYKKAKTLQEAITQTKIFSDVATDFEKVKLDRLNIVNKSIIELQDDFPLSYKMTRFQTKTRMKANANATRDGIQYNRTTLNANDITETNIRFAENNIKRREQIQIAKRYIKEVEENKTMSQVEKRMRLKQYNNYIKKNSKAFKYKRWTIKGSGDLERDVKRLTQHEYAHTIHLQYFEEVNWNKTIQGKLNKLRNSGNLDKLNSISPKLDEMKWRIRRNHKKMNKDESIYNVGMYANSNFLECFAETFVMYNDPKEKEKLPKYIVETFDDIKNIIKEVNRL
jgi:hypothetical protein